MIQKWLLIFFLLSQNFCFAYTKQNDEYSCGVFSGFNLIKESCLTCETCTPDELKLLLKTDKNGTTSYNLCNGLNQYFNSQNKIADIRYYGIKKVPKYKIDNTIDLLKLKHLIDNGYYAILNIGIYKKNKNLYNRSYGHYVNLVSIEKCNLIVFDPYDKNKRFNKWKISKTNVQTNNINDNEDYEEEQEYIKINTHIQYLKQDEIALINGLIFVKCFE